MTCLVQEGQQGENGGGEPPPPSHRQVPPGEAPATRLTLPSPTPNPAVRFTVDDFALFSLPWRGALHSSLTVLMCYQVLEIRFSLGGYLPPFHPALSSRATRASIRAHPGGRDAYRPITFYGAGIPPDLAPLTSHQWGRAPDKRVSYIAHPL